MTQKQLQRGEVFTELMAGALTTQQAAERLRLCSRQIRRLRR